MKIFKNASLTLCSGLLLAWPLQASTDISVTNTTVVSNAKRMGINLGGHNFYDSGQYLKNLINGNPGFEPLLYQTIVGCASGGGDTCTDNQQYDTFPNHFFQYGTFRVISGQAKGRTGSIVDSNTSTPYSVTSFQFTSGSPAIAPGDYVVVEQQSSGIPLPGTVNSGYQASPINDWWTDTSGGGTFSADTVTADQAPGTAGVQCLKMDASGGRSLGLKSAFDSTLGHTFLQLNGQYQLSFKAKLISGTNPMQVTVARNATYLSQSVPLTSSWQTFNLPFSASENGSATGVGWITFNITDMAILIDDVSLVPVGGDGTNTTVYTDAMVSTLRTLHPGIIRDWEGQLGDSLDNQIAPAFGRMPSAFSVNFNGGVAQEGLHEFLQLCELIGAEPWYVIPTNWSATDMQNLMEYLGGSAGTTYGAKRVALGHATPWTSTFSQMHFEFGNEDWNGGFAGGIIGQLNFSSDLVTYAKRSSELFGAAKSSAYYQGNKFDFVMGGQAVVAYSAGTEANASTQNDSYATAPYIGSYATDGSDEQLFGPLFAETEWWSQTNGYQGQNAAALKSSSHPVPLSDYEENMNSVNGLSSQASVNAFLPSLGAGLALGNSMLMQLRDQGIVNQNIFALPQYNFSYNNQTDPIWGIVYDMGVTNRKRPQFLAAQIINQGIGNGANVLQTVQTGDNPTWNGSFTPDGSTVEQVPNAQYLESFAFSNGSIIVMNLSRDTALNVTFSGPHAPTGNLVMQRLTSGSLRDNNETSNVVGITSTNMTNFNPAQPLTLPAFSMTMLMPQSGGSAPPTVSITSPSSGASVTAGSNVTINATAASSGGTISKVDFYQGNTLLGTSSSSPYSYSWTNVSAGSYLLTAVATDNTGTTTTSNQVPITVTSANPPPTVSLTSPASGANFASGSNVTMNATAASGHGTVSRVDFYQGGTLLGSSSSSPYSLTWTNVPGGSYSLSAIATDNLGQTTTSSAVAITVGAANPPPAVSITSPSNGASYTAGSAITINASATSGNGTISKVDFYQGSTLLGTGTSSPYSFTWSNVAAGSYSLKAIATDNSSQTTTSSLVSVTVASGGSTGPPSISITNPLSGAGFTAGSNITINVTASASGATVSQIDFYQGSTCIGSAFSSPYSFTWTSVPAGTYSLGAIVFDSAGGSSAASHVSIVVGAPPTVSLTSPSSGASFTAGATVSITAAAASSGGTISKVDFYQGSTLLGTSTSSPYTFSWTNVAAGNYSLKAIATDNLGATTTSSLTPITVSAPNPPPTVSVTSPANGTSFAAGATITINATAASANGTISKVDFYQGTTLLGTKASSPYSFSWTNVASGSYQLKAIATDNLGATTTSSLVSVTVASAGSTPPSISITAPTGGASFTAGSNITITATASSTNGSVTKVDFYQSSTYLGSALSSPYTYLWNGVPAGSYMVKALVFDSSGATNAATPVAISVNPPPTLSLTTPSNGASYAAGATIAITAAAASSGGTISRVDFYKGTTLLGSKTSSPYTYSLTNATSGSTPLRAIATDNLGATTTSSIVTVNVVSPPTVGITSPSNGNSYTAGATIAITATASSNGTINKVDFYQGTTLLGSVASSPYTFNWTSVAAGNYSLKAIATDNVGSTTPSSVVTITVNSAGAPPPPVVTLTSPSNNAGYVAGASIVLNATASSANGTISKVDFYQGTTFLGSASASPYSYTWATVAAGSYALKAVATDNTGATTTSGVVNVSVNAIQQPPVISLTSPANNATLPLGRSITINAPASSNTGTISEVDFYQGTTFLGSSTSSPYSYTWSDVLAGTYQLSAIATDNSGNTTASSVVTITVAPSASLVGIMSPSNDETFSAPASITIMATTSGGSSVHSVSFYQGSTLLGVSNSSPYSYTWNNVPAGTYTLTADVMDTSNAITPSASVTVTVNAAATSFVGFSGSSSGVRVYPNPWRSDRHAGKDIIFDHAQPNVMVKLLTISGHWIKSITTDATGIARWDRTTDGGEQAASGVYLFLTDDSSGAKARGKFTILR